MDKPVRMHILRVQKYMSNMDVRANKNIIFRNVHHGEMCDMKSDIWVQLRNLRNSFPVWLAICSF